MAELLLSGSALLLAASYFWLAVRIVNRREQWAKRLLIAIVALPLPYAAGFGPACWWFSDTIELRQETFREAPIVYWPVGMALAQENLVFRRIICWYGALLSEDAIIVPAAPVYRDSPLVIIGAGRVKPAR